MTVNPFIAPSTTSPNANEEDCLAINHQVNPLWKELIKRNDSTDEFAPEDYRDEFYRDRDRIVLSKAFRRLSGKTQVVIPRQNEHLRTRLTHTIEVSQLSRTVAAALHLNTMLTEAIALGHDLGHTPFGHVGEDTLNEIMNNCDGKGKILDNHELTKGFKHNHQGIRVLSEKEELYGKPGLDITNFTLWGILNHTKRKYKDHCTHFWENGPDNCYLNRQAKSCNQKEKGKYQLDFYEQYRPLFAIPTGQEAWSFEGIVVGLVDEIAQRHSDTEDAILLEIVDIETMIQRLRNDFGPFVRKVKRNITLIEKKAEKDIREGKIPDPDYDGLLSEASPKNQKISVEAAISFIRKFLTSLYLENLIETSVENLREFRQHYNIHTSGRFREVYPTIDPEAAKEVVRFSDEFSKADDKFHTFIKNRILNSHLVQQMDGKGTHVIRQLFESYVTNPRQLPDSTIYWVYKTYYEKKRMEAEQDKEKKLADKILPNGKKIYEILKPGEYIDDVLPNDKTTIGEMRDDIEKPCWKNDTSFQIILMRAITDNIASMTDEHALQQFHRLYSA